MTSTSRALDTAATPRPVFGPILGLLSMTAGALLLVVWVQQRFLPSLLSLPPVPFFDNLVPWSGRSAMVLGRTRLVAFGIAHLVGACALVLTGWALVTCRRASRVLFPVAGWGGFLFTVAALWPGETLRFKAHTWVTTQERIGAIPPGTGFWGAVPALAIDLVILFAALWIALLVAGTVHVARKGPLYDR